MSATKPVDTANVQWESVKTRMLSILERLAAFFEWMVRQWRIILFNTIVLPALAIVYWTIIAAGTRTLAPILATKLYKVPVPGLFAWMRHYVTWRDIDVANILSLIVLAFVWVSVGLMMHILIHGEFRIGTPREPFVRAFILTTAPVLLLADAALFYAALSETGSLFATGRIALSPIIMTVLYTTLLLFLAFIEVLLEDRDSPT